MSNGDFEDDWEPVSQAEMKVIQAKQERSNKISKIMGDYLLKGYKMLASSCEDCGCILLQDKQSQLYCVACNECEVEGSKDDPALSQIAADSKIREGASPATSSCDADTDDAVCGDGPPSSLPSSSLAMPGIPSLMNAAPLVNGNANGGTANIPGSELGATASAGTSQPKNRHKGKMTTRIGNRAAGVGVRSLMSDVGRNAYEAFAAYQDDCTPPAAPVASLPPATNPVVTLAKSATPPPHGPSVCGDFGKLAPSEYESLSGTLKRKLIHAGQRLERSTSTEEDKALCALIKSYAEALEAVNSAQNS